MQQKQLAANMLETAQKQRHSNCTTAGNPLGGMACRTLHVDKLTAEAGMTGIVTRFSPPPRIIGNFFPGRGYYGRTYS